MPADDLLLERDLTYLQTGSVGPTPRPVMDRCIAAWRELEQNPVLHGYKLNLPVMEDVRAKAASLLGCMQGEVIITRSTTDGMNAVAAGLDLSPGDRVLTTDQEHGGGRKCWEYLAAHRGVVLDEVTIPHGEHDVGLIIERFRKAVTPRTRVISFSHVLHTTGLRMPAPELCLLARELGCLAVVDGAQAAGAIPVDVASMGCDVYATTSHKWMLGPKGVGMLVLREQARDRVRLFAEQANRSVQSDSTGLLNIPAVVGLGAAIDYIKSLGIDQIEAHNLHLHAHGHELLCEMPHVQLLSPPPGPLASPLIAAQLPDTADCRLIVAALLSQHRVMLKPLPLLNAVRFSTHLFNTTRDIEHAALSLRRELARHQVD